MDYRFIWEQVQTGKLQDYHVSTNDQLADIFTKPVATARFTELQSKMQVANGNFILRGRAYWIIMNRNYHLKLFKYFRLYLLIIGVSFLVLSSCYPSCNLDLYLSLSSRSLTSRNNYQYIFVSCISWIQHTKFHTLLPSLHMLKPSSNKTLVYEKEMHRLMDANTCPKESIVQRTLCNMRPMYDLSLYTSILSLDHQSPISLRNAINY